MARILLVDDARTVRLICRRVVAAMGFDVVEADNGESALRAVKDNTDVDLILLDWHMPVMDGLTFLKTLRADSDLPQPRVVMCTTQNEIQNIADALDAGADEYIMKPFTEEIIREKVMEACVH